MTSDAIAETTEAATPATKAGAGALGIIVLLMGFTFMNHFNRVSMASAGDTAIMTQYDISPTRMGVVYSAFLLMYTIGMFPGGLLIDRIGTRAALLFVAFGSGLFVALTGVTGLMTGDASTLIFALLIVRGCMGLCSAPIHPACAQAVGHWIPPGSRARANGTVNSMALVGVSVTPLVFSAMIHAFGWPISFMIAGSITAAVGVAWAVIARDRPDVAHDDHWEVVPDKPPIHWTRLFRHRGLVILTISYGAVGYFQYLFMYWMNYYFQEVQKLPQQESHWLAALPPLGMAVGMPLGGWLSDLAERKLGRRRGFRIVPMAGMIAGAVLLGAGVFASHPYWIVTWFALAMCGVGMSEGPFWATAVRLGGPRGGSSGGFLNTGGNLLGMLAPTVTPWVGSLYGWGAALALGGLISLAGVVLWLAIDPEETL